MLLFIRFYARALNFISIIELLSVRYEYYSVVSSIQVNRLKCFQLLKLIASVVCREDDHIMLEEIQTSLQRSMRKMQPPQQTSSLTLLYQLYQNPTYSLTFRSHCITRIFAAVATHCDVTALIEFFKEHVTEVMELVCGDITQVCFSSLECYR